MSPEVSSAINNIFYLVLFLVGITIYFMWRWGETCRTKVQVLVVKADGHGEYEYAKQEGGSVSLRKPGSDTIRMWPINELATIMVPYPNNGLVPKFLEKSIRQVTVDEKDWEPMINRSQYRGNIASPDVIGTLREFADEIENADQRQLLLSYTEVLIAAPTRELIASPAVLGNLVHEKVTEALITVNKQIIDNLSKLIKRMSKVVSPSTIYICTGIVLVAIGGFAYWLAPQIAEISRALSGS